MHSFAVPPPPPPPPVAMLLNMNAFPTPYGTPPMPFNSMPTQIQQIPTPNPLPLNKIPAPRDLDLTAIPEPQMNIESIKMPGDATVQHQFHHQPVGG